MVSVMIKYIFLFILSFSVNASEADYQKAWCPNNPGTTIRDKLTNEVVGYVDCLTETVAYEFDYARKYHEAIGQSLWYAMNTGRKAGIVLILEKESDKKYLKRLQMEIEHYNLPIEKPIVITPSILK